MSHKKSHSLHFLYISMLNSIWTIISSFQIPHSKMQPSFGIIAAVRMEMKCCQCHHQYHIYLSISKAHSEYLRAGRKMFTHSVLSTVQIIFILHLGLGGIRRCWEIRFKFYFPICLSLAGDRFYCPLLSFTGGPLFNLLFPLSKPTCFLVNTTFFHVSL